jgi:hypothetical protein
MLREKVAAELRGIRPNSNKADRVEKKGQRIIKIFIDDIIPRTVDPMFSNKKVNPPFRLAIIQNLVGLF